MSVAELELPGRQRVAIRAAFGAMSIAEDEIASAFPCRADEPKGLFLALALPDVMKHMTLDLYRAHARELVDRARTGEDLALATRAEVLAGLYGASARAPLRREAWAIYRRLFAELLPDLFASLPPDVRQADHEERWEGQVEEDIRSAQRSLRDESRRVRRAA